MATGNRHGKVLSVDTVRQRGLDELLVQIKSCRHCLSSPQGPPLPHEPRPVLVAGTRAKICVIGQAPGTKVHASGRPFTDRSGDRLRDWMGVTREQFYNPQLVNIIPMGFCFPGLNDKGGDLPPRRECAAKWHPQLFELMPQFELILLVGLYAQRRYLGNQRKTTLGETVKAWRDYVVEQETGGRRVKRLPMPHPSWRNNAWLRKNPFFERDVIPFLRHNVKELIAAPYNKL